MDARIDPVAFALQKDSEFFELFNYYMIKLYHSGVLEYLRTKWFDDRKPQACSCKTEEVILASSPFQILRALLLHGKTLCRPRPLDLTICSCPPWWCRRGPSSPSSPSPWRPFCTSPSEGGSALPGRARGAGSGGTSAHPRPADVPAALRRRRRRPAEEPKS